MRLSTTDVVHHLLRLGLLTTADVVDGSLHIAETTARNQLFRVNSGETRGFVVKQPNKPDPAERATLWMEATMYWLADNDPAFSSLSTFMPAWYHFDERNLILTTELLTNSESLHLHASGMKSDHEPIAAKLASALATLHGQVTVAARSGPAAKLFSSMPPWALSLDDPNGRYQPLTPAAVQALGHLRADAPALAALHVARHTWNGGHLMHGDMKAVNVLIDERRNRDVKVIDWELAGFGDRFWDVAGAVHSYLMPGIYTHGTLYGPTFERARRSIGALWRTYCAQFAHEPQIAAYLPIVVRYAGIRLIQTSLEAAAIMSDLLPQWQRIQIAGQQITAQPDAFAAVLAA